MRVAFRVDASVQIGTGHVMRCLTLAEGLKERGAEICFVCRHLTRGLECLVLENGYDLRRLEPSGGEEAEGDLPHSPWLGVPQDLDASQSAQALSGQAWDWIVVDHYALDHRWETPMRQVARRILAIDDLADRRHDCDLLLDQNLYEGMDARYADKVPPRTEQLLGPKFALLRDEFRELRGQVRPRSGPVRRILIFFGGVDAANLTRRAIETVAGLEAAFLHVDVVIGESHPQKAQIISRCAELGFQCHVQTRRMAELMAEADLAIGAAGSSIWERCCLGLPALAFPVAANQRKVLVDAAARGLLWAAALSGDWGLALDRDLRVLVANEPLRRHFSRAGLETVDGRGVSRVAARMGCFGVQMAPVSAGLAEKLFEWRNHPSIRAVSHHQAPLQWEMHQRWVADVMKDPCRDLLVGTYAGIEIGVVRFDVKGEAAEVSIYLVPGAGGPCSGRDLLLAAECWIADRRPGLKRITAEVLGANQASHGLFRSCAYSIDSTTYSKRLR